MFSVHTSCKEFDDATITIGQFGFVFKENSSKEITSYLRCDRFRKILFLMNVDGRTNRRNKAAFLNFCGAIWTGPKIEGSSRIHRLPDIYTLLTERDELKI